MVGCTIPFCNNSSEKGYVMKAIPRNTQRGVQWINNINTKYKNWIPSNHSCICEVKLFVLCIFTILLLFN
ncbi:unnamed protein product [Lasius platythorax]|uniref:THAP-type domain-containing protein n=1 Tax=Lasius platythorax TaxID=488582 RepID=A0AAV2MWX4_9HYME